MPFDLTAAIAQHRRGDLARAAEAYETALAEDPDRAEVLHLLGTLCLQRGEAARAVELLSRATALRPEEPSDHARLADACWALGDLDRAAGCGREALRLAPENVEILCNLGATLVDLGAIETAIEHFRKAVQIDPANAPAHNNLGNALSRLGRLEDAIEHLRKAVTLDPAAAGAQSNLGKALLDRNLATEAVIPCAEAVRLAPDLLAARINLGNALHTLGRLDEASAAFREAIRRKPNLASAHAGLGGVLEQLGRFDAAEAAHREALRHDPRHAGVLGRLATRLKARLPDADRATIERLLGDPALPAEKRWPLQFGLAHVLDAQRDFDRAAALSLEANALQRADFRARGLGYDPAAHRTFVERLLSSFTPEFFERVRGWGLETRRPIFVVGLPRSGTSLVEQILASHPGIFGAGELPLARDSFQAFSSTAANPLDRDAIQTLARRHLDGLDALDRSAERVVDKMPENSLYVGMLSALFPNARVIHCQRDRRDVALSCWMTHFGQVRWACDFEHIRSRFHESARLMEHWRRALPIAPFEVDYEALVRDVPTVARGLIDACGLGWDEACLDFDQSKRAVRTASLAQVRRPVHGSSVGRWRNYEGSLAPLFEGLAGSPSSNPSTRDQS